MMLEHLDAPQAAAALRTAIEDSLRQPQTRTADVGGTAGTEQVTAAVLDRLPPKD
jgi:tartrate dehydrogenase/decarboxylase/D-malate dehydrogenase